MLKNLRTAKKVALGITAASAVTVAAATTYLKKSGALDKKGKK